MINAENFINNIKNNEITFLVIISQSNLFKNSHAIHVMNVIIKIFTFEKLSLFKKYENYVNIFSVKKIIKCNKFKNTEHLIDFLFEKNSSYKLIYNLLIQELSILQKYIHFFLDKN